MTKKDKKISTDKKELVIIFYLNEINKINC